MEQMWRYAFPAVAGLLAAVMSYAAMQSGARPMSLTAVNKDLPTGTIVTDAMLTNVSIRGERAIVQSAVPYEDRGAALLGRKLRRAVKEHEVLFFDDVRVAGAQGVSYSLGPKERLLQVSLESIRCAPGVLRIGVDIGFVLGDSTELDVGDPPDGAALVGRRPTPSAPSKSEPMRILGPYRVVSIGDRSDPLETPAPGMQEEAKTIGVAIQPQNDQLREQDSSLVQALARTGGSAKGPRVVALVVFPVSVASP